MLQRPRGESSHSDFDTQSRSNLLQTERHVVGLSNGGWANGFHVLVTWQLSNEIKWPLLQGTPTDYCTPHYIVQLPTIHSASPISIYLL